MDDGVVIHDASSNLKESFLTTIFFGLSVLIYLPCFLAHLSRKIRIGSLVPTGNSHTIIL